MSPGTPGVSREAKSSTNLNLVVCCAKIGSKTKKLQKSVKKPQFFDNFLVIFEVF